MSIREEVRGHLKAKGSITRLEALGLYGCMDVTTVIRDLRHGSSPMKISTSMRTDRNGKRYARYIFGNPTRKTTV
jgi:hypothetical protein